MKFSLKMILSIPSLLVLRWIMLPANTQHEVMSSAGLDQIYFGGIAYLILHFAIVLFLIYRVWNTPSATIHDRMGWAVLLLFTGVVTVLTYIWVMDDRLKIESLTPKPIQT